MAECSKASAVSKVTVTDAVNFVYSAKCDGVRGSGFAGTQKRSRPHAN